MKQILSSLHKLYTNDTDIRCGGLLKRFLVVIVSLLQTAHFLCHSFPQISCLHHQQHHHFHDPCHPSFSSIFVTPNLCDQGGSAFVPINGCERCKCIPSPTENRDNNKRTVQEQIWQIDCWLLQWWSQPRRRIPKSSLSRPNTKSFVL